MKYLMAIIIGLPVLLSALDYQTEALNTKGEAKVLIEPNVAEFRLGMTVKHKEIDSALVKIGETADAVQKIFKKYGLDKNSAKIKNIQIGEDFDYDNPGRKKVFRGYEAKRFYEIKFTQLKDLSEFLLEANLAGANDLNNLNFSHTQSDSIENSLLTKAILNAKKSAEIAAKAAGVKIKKVMVISDQPPKNYAYQNRVDFDMPGFGEGGLPETTGGLKRGAGLKSKAYQGLFEIEPGKIEIIKSVWVTYQIK